MRTTAGESVATEMAGTDERLLPKLKVLFLPGQPVPVTPLCTVLTEGSIELGREASTGFDINLGHDLRMSRRHARLHLGAAGGPVHIQDCQSRNGTAVNGHAIGSAGVTLCDGDLIRIGGTLLLFRTEAVKPLDALMPELDGSSPAIAKLRYHIACCAADRSPVCLLGETGSGKERAAEAIHRLSGRLGPLEITNCGGKNEGLIGGDFFGHVAGAFTDARRSRKGHFREAHQGTLFLDEIAEFPLALQPVLLRSLQNGKVVPIGGQRCDAVTVDVRIISATHRDLAAAVHAGQFREDLYWRLCHIQLAVPPLRERREDILPLLQQLMGSSLAQLPTRQAELMLCHAWPGNFRALQAIAARWRTAGTDFAWSSLLPTHSLPINQASTSAPSPAKSPRRQAVDRTAVETELRACNGNMNATALRLSVPRSRLYELCNRYGISPGTFRSPKSSDVVPR